MKAYFKSIYKLIIHNFSRFLTIILIITLGIAFLVGLFSVSPDLKLSYNKILTDQNISELYFKTNSIFTEAEINYLNSLETKEDYQIYGTYEEDKLVTIKKNSKENNYNAKVVYRDIDNKQDNLKLIKGRYPERQGEVLIEQSGKYFVDIPYGSNITIDGNEYTICGIVQNPWYLMKEKYTSDNQGVLETIIYIDDTYIYKNKEKKIKRYNNLYLDYGKDTNCFSLNFASYLDELRTEFEANKVNLSNIQKDSFKRFIKDSIIEQMLDEEKIYKYYNNEEISLAPILNISFTYDILEAELNKENVEGYFSQLKYLIDEQVKLAEEQMIKATGEAYLNYYLTLAESMSFYQFNMYVEKVEDVSLVFPIFFFIITSLVVMSTLRRLIYEERTTIGTMRAIGFSKEQIKWRYLSYGLLAAFCGTLIGSVIGIYVIPIVVFNAYATTCHLTDFIVSFSPLVGSISIILMFALTSIIILLTLRGPLKETPNNLLTTKPVVKGSKVFLENITFIWKHLKFKYKSTVRNMIRYKRNLIMMLVGISGTTGLLLVGFGIRDSINDISRLEFEEVLYYDAICTTNDYDKLQDDDILSKYQIYYDEVAYDEFNTKVIIADDNINNYINLGNNFSENDCAITKQLAKELDLNINDKITYNNQDFTITKIFDNYVDNYLIISNNLIKKEYNKVLLILDDLTIEEESALLDRLIAADMVTMITFTSSLSSTFDALLSNLNMIVIVIVIFSAALTFVVVYNLININVCEREREIATLLVLGYSNIECHGYIARETFILTTIGSLLGLGVGKLLHMFVCFVIDTPQMYVPRTIHPLSYILSIGATLIFTVIIDLCFIPKYRKISMTESLKAID